MARKMLHGTNFVVVRRWEQTDDVLQGTLIRLSRTIDQVPINSPKDFFKLAATNIRWELQTLRDKLNAKKADARWYQSDVHPDHKGGPPAHGNIADRAETRNDGFMQVSRLLDEIETISEDDREMIDLVIIDGLTRQEAADTMGLALATFNRRYRDACTRLGEKLGDMDPPAP
jgi:RNA polymerase sigma-70 factor (ECF subfamily)